MRRIPASYPKVGENNKKIPEFWGENYQNGFTERMWKIAGEMGGLGICWNDYSDESFTYIIAIEKPAAGVEESVDEYTVPASTWAVFESVGPMPDSIQKVWERIFSEWFPATSFEHADAPDLEVYPQGDSQSENYRCQIWVPIIKK
jgi:AraC family transcriptional regulator